MLVLETVPDMAGKFAHEIIPALIFRSIRLTVSAQPRDMSRSVAGAHASADEHVIMKTSVVMLSLIHSLSDDEYAPFVRRSKISETFALSALTRDRGNVVCVPQNMAMSRPLTSGPSITRLISRRALGSGSSRKLTIRARVR
ncbi:hypothetical protein AXW83_12100 [Bosea sp. PAMC 26642]|nr:hypothetical protein AXW83_12100 [Bosea sp. PAMC 26642]